MESKPENPDEIDLQILKRSQTNARATWKPSDNLGLSAPAIVLLSLKDIPELPPGTKT